MPHWALHYLNWTVVVNLDADHDQVWRLYGEEPDLLDITPYDPEMPDLEMAREAAKLAGVDHGRLQ